MISMEATTQKLRARTSDEKRQKKQRILDAAKEVFFDHGYSAVTVGMITRKAGVSTGTFYLYYKTKIEIYKDLQNEGLDILTDMIGAVIKDNSYPPLEKLREIAFAYVRFSREYREYFDIIAVLSATPAELKETDSDISRLIDGKTHRLLSDIEAILREGVKKGDVVPLDTWHATSALWALMDGMVLLSERNNLDNVIKVGMDELIEQGLKMFFFGIAKNRKRKIP